MTLDTSEDGGLSKALRALDQPFEVSSLELLEHRPFGVLEWQHVTGRRGIGIGPAPTKHALEHDVGGRDDLASGEPRETLDALAKIPHVVRVVAVAKQLQCFARN